MMKEVLTGMALLLVATQGMGQERKSLPDVSPTVKGNLVLPVPLNNRIFTDITESIGALDGCIQMPFHKGLGAGAGYRGNWFSIQERVLAPQVTSGDVYRGTWYGKVQYERYIGPRAFYELALRAGMSHYRFNSNLCPEPKRYNAFHWGATTSLYLHATDNLAFGLMFGYERDAEYLSPDMLCLDRWPGRTDGVSRKPFQYLLVGLGFSTRLRRSDEGPRGW